MDSIPAPVTPEPSHSEPAPYSRRFLRYWSLNVALARRQGWAWIPGFPYSDAELARIEAIAASVSFGATAVWLLATTILFIVIAGAAMLGVMWPIVTVAWPDPATMPAAPFFVLMAMQIGLALCIVLPLSLTLGGAIADRANTAPPMTDAPEDAALCRKMRAQFWRFGAVFAGLFVPAALVFSALGIEAHWVSTALHAASVVLFLLGVLCYRASRRLAR